MADYSSWTQSRWLLRRFGPTLVLSALFGAACGGLRVGNFFLVGIQGMAAGGFSGWMAGRLGREDPDTLWSFPQRIYLSLSSALVFTLTSVMVLSMAKAALFDMPWEWLEDVLQGSQGELFLGIKRSGSTSGYLTGGFWIAFNLLDAALFAFLFLALTVVGLTGKTGENQASEMSAATAVSLPTESELSTENSRKPFAFYGFWFLLGSMVLSTAVLWAYLDRREQLDHPYHGANFMATLQKNKGLVGRWIIADGHGLFDPAEEVEFEVKLAGFAQLTGKSVPEGRFQLDFENRSARYQGKLIRPGRIFWYPLRMQVTPDAREMTMVVEVAGTRGLQKIILKARKK